MIHSLFLLVFFYQFHSTVVFDIDHTDYQSIRTHLNSINWANLLNTCSNLNSMWNTFHGLLNNTCSLYCPIHQPKPHRSFSLHKNILTIMQCKHWAWRNMKSNSNTITKYAFKNISNMSRRAIRVLYREIELTVLHSNNIRSFYAYVNSCISSRPASP